MQVGHRDALELGERIKGSNNIGTRTGAYRGKTLDIAKSSGLKRIEGSEGSSDNPIGAGVVKL